MFETTLTVPTHHVRDLMRRLSGAGFTVLDTGMRVATDAGPDGEATLRLVHAPMLEVELADLDGCALGVVP